MADYKGVVEHMVAASGKPLSQVSTEIGRARTFLNASMAREGWSPRADTLAEICGACGYELVARGHGEEIPLGGAGAPIR